VIRRAIIASENERPSIVCLDCGARSHSLGDVEHLYCRLCGRSDAESECLCERAQDDFVSWRGISPFATPSFRKSIGIEPRIFEPPRPLGALACRFGIHRYSIEVRAVVLETFDRIAFWGVPEKAFPSELLSLSLAPPLRGGLVRVAFLECQRCGVIHPPLRIRHRRRAEEALSRVPG
jgi:hypothetical protein